ncbi:hypothetical protein ARALYDRAFT_893487 [Arabidopsis lyrata subsp. lyrata]|uniref:Uncharacterized protein n=1 Tax=Arabidopsis lyrata subsp. lyrata TaxID=81972 RepID=D7KWS5_ARALL|nr:hypothetical protein ARALYDRAFT_893487 [Arabidopsis lyrata subsp. lyrata]
MNLITCFEMFEERGSWRSSRDQCNRSGGDDDKSQHRKDEDKSSWRHDKSLTMS